GLPATHVPGLPPSQFGTTRRQAPMPQVVLPKPSSTSPSQSSSALLQTSGTGSPGMQMVATPSTQVGGVRLQAPTPQESVPSSGTPLQSLSTRSHVSARPGWALGLRSSQSLSASVAPQRRKPSRSTSDSSAGTVPLQS